MKRIYILFGFAFACFCASAQNGNMNQTVQVTNKYKTDLNNFEKSPSETFIPDSLYTFNLNFDYSGLTNPYKGASLGFSPSYTNLELARVQKKTDVFYMRLGAGYTFRPELDLEWMFWSGKRVKLGMFARSRSHVGNYHDVKPVDGVLRKSGESGFGYSSMSLLGLNGRADWETFRLRFDVSYDGVFSQLTPYMQNSKRSYNSFRTKLDFSSVNDDRMNNFRYGAKIDYVLGSSILVGADGGRNDFVEHNLLVSAEGGYDFSNGHSAQMDLDVSANLSGNYNCVLSVLRPKYAFSSDRFKVDAGLGMLVTTSANVDRGRGVLDVWPIMNLEWKAVDGWLDVFAKADIKGEFYGARMSAFNDVFNIPVMDGSDMRYAAVKHHTIGGGFRGSGWDVFSYEVGAGYANIENCPLYSVEFSSGVPSLSVVMREIYNANVHVNLGLDMAGVGVGVKAEYLHYFGTNASSFSPSAFNADVFVSYNVKSRILPKVGCAFQSPYRSNEYKTPFVYDLYASVEGRLNNNLSLYLKGSNLLNRANQYIPMIASKGVSITAGVVLNF